jgi:hypothetical protein
METLIQFFYDHAGWSYDSKIETSEQGRRKCAELLARAASRAFNDGVYFEWSIDPYTDSSEFSSKSNPWSLWVCRMCDSNGNMVDSLYAIDFGRDGSPYGDPYRRVVEAELALSHYSDMEV